MCGQVWWPILGICPLHLTHPSAHSQQWTHTRSSGQPYCGARGAVGGSVPCSRVSPQSWYWKWREHLLFTPPTDNPCRTWESNLQPLGYKSNSLTIRPRLPRRRVSLNQGSEPVQGTRMKMKTGNEGNFDRNRTRNEIKFYSSEQNKKKALTG